MSGGFTLIDGEDGSAEDIFATTAQKLTYNDWKTMHKILNMNQPTLLDSIIDLMKSIHKLGKEDSSPKHHQIVDWFVNYIRKEKPDWSTTVDPVEFSTINNEFRKYINKVIPPRDLFRELDGRIYNHSADVDECIYNNSSCPVSILTHDEMD